MRPFRKKDKVLRYSAGVMPSFFERTKARWRASPEEVLMEGIHLARSEMGLPSFFALRSAFNCSSMMQKASSSTGVPKAAK